MSTYMFGVSTLTVDPATAALVRSALEANELSRLADRLARESGPHVLPRLGPGTAEALARVRSRHLDWLRLAFDHETLAGCLLRELRGMARSLPTPVVPIVVDGGSEIIENEWWWWICEPDCEDPDWAHWEEHGDPIDGEMYDEDRCYELYPDGSVESVECYGEEGEGFLCC